MKQLGIPAVLLMLIAAAPAAQQTPPAPAQQPPPKFRSGVQLIEVDARVFDKDGRFITDLTKDDFEVLEDDAPQRIDAMYLVTGPGAGAPVTPAPPAVPGAPDRRPEPPAPVAPQTWVFYFDLNHLTPGTGFDRAKKAVEDFIALRFKDGDLAGILAGERMVGNRLTSVRKELLSALEEVKPRSDRRNLMNELTQDWPRFLNEEEAIRVARNQRDVMDRVIERACRDDPQLCAKVDPEPAVRSKGTRFQQDIHRASVQTLTSINALASGLSKIPGPKTVVLLSDGIVVQDIETTLRSVVGQTARAGARIYAIDVRGLGRIGSSAIIDQGYSYEPEAAGVRFDGLADGTNSLAIDTGGLMIRNENNIGRALDRIADDAGRYYVLAYQPANTNFDGKYRPIQVRVKREGLRVRARKGYLALAPSRMTVPQPVQTPDVTAAETADSAPAPPFGPPAPPEWPTPVPGLPDSIKPATPVPATPVTGTRTTADETEPAGGALRMRPDANARVRELSGGETATASTLAAEGWAAYQRGDIEAAVGPLAQAAAQPGVRPWVLYALGLAQGGLGRPHDAIASWERVRQTAPAFAPVYIDLAATHASLSDLTSALAVLRDAEQRWPNDPEVHNAIGVIHFRRGALDEAIAAFSRAASAAPDDPLAHLNLGRAYELRFTRSRRYVTSQRRWVVDEGDRLKGIKHYQACLRIGGPFVNAATDGLQRLEWSK